MPTRVEIAIDRNGRVERRSGRWLIGADGASSNVRRSLGIEFEGFTWPERFLVVSTPFDFNTVIPDLVAVSYLADPDRWHFLLHIPGLCRVMFLVKPDESDERALSREFAQSLMATVVPGISNYEISHTTLYRVHQRVAKTFRVGRVFLAGDAAHVNNPLGGMGMNGGIHDAMNLTTRLIEVWRGTAPAGRTRPLRPAAPAGDQGNHRDAVDSKQAKPRIIRPGIPGPVCGTLWRTAAAPTTTCCGCRCSQASAGAGIGLIGLFPSLHRHAEGGMPPGHKSAATSPTIKGSIFGVGVGRHERDAACSMDGRRADQIAARALWHCTACADHRSRRQS